MAEGFWGPTTASIDWCEENYEVSYYLAEFWNSISSLTFCLVTLAEVYFIVVNPYHSQDSKKDEDEEKGGRTKNGFEARFVALIISICVVGIGSFLFHGTMWYSMQMADELPMTWSALVSVFICLENNLNRSLPKVAVGLWVYGIVSTAWQVYLTRTFPILHEIQFGILLGFGFLATLRYTHNRKMWEITLLFYLHAVLLFVAFFGCWVPDQVFCGFWRSLGKFNPQLHAFWHILMSFAVHFSSLIAQYQRAENLQQNPQWRKIGFLPIAVSISPTSKKTKSKTKKKEIFFIREGWR